MAIRHGEVLDVAGYTHVLQTTAIAFNQALDVIYDEWQSNGSELAQVPREGHALLLHGSNGEGLTGAKPPRTDSDIDPQTILNIPGGDILDFTWWNGVILCEMQQELAGTLYVDDSHPSAGLTGADYPGIVATLETVREVDGRSGVTLIAYPGSALPDIVARAGEEAGINVNVYLINV